MSLDSVKRSFVDKLGSLGKVGLNGLYPKDFELYVFALELVNSKGDTEEYFLFPINPSNFEESAPANTSVVKTMGGIVTIDSNTFDPVDIMMSGNFGQKFKALIGGELIDFGALSYSSKAGVFSPSKANGTFKETIFNSKIKTGYGCIKLLQTIVEKSRGLDQFNKPYSLYLYNLALGNNYLAKVLNLTFKQDMSSNKIWNYTLQIKGIGTMESIQGVRSQKALSVSLGFTKIVQGGANVALGKAKNLLKL